jgi:hypothetical protein
VKQSPKPTRSARERLLLIALPTIAGVALYSAFVYPGQVSRLRAARQRLSKAESQRANESATVLSGAALASELAKVLSDERELSARIARLEGRSAPPSRRTEALVAVVEVLRAHGLTVVEEAPAKGRPVQAAASRRGAIPAAVGGQSWQIRFLGSYTGVLRALRALQSLDSPCFPQGLSVAEPQPGADWRDWTLTLALL